MTIRWTRSTKIAVLLAVPLLLGGIAAAAVRADRSSHSSQDSGATASSAQQEEDSEQRMQAYLASLAGHRAQALAALRLRVPSSEVRDEDVAVIFWEPISSNQATPFSLDPGKTAFLGGYWLGKDRSCVLAWESKANEIVSLHDLMGPRPDHMGKPRPPPIFTDLRAEDDASRRAFASMAKHARYRHRPVVPISFEPIAGGQLKAKYVDGWDDGCGTLSIGDLVVDLERGLVQMGAHLQ